jgi:hypothetical protein
MTANSHLAAPTGQRSANDQHTIDGSKMRE